ncbi:hypothetical protein MASR1M32_25580 [Rhodobacter sp.]
MIDGRFDQHFLEVFAGRDENPPPRPAESTALGPLVLASLLAGLALLASVPFLV